MADIQYKVTTEGREATHVTVCRDGKPIGTVSVEEYSGTQLGNKEAIILDPLGEVLKRHAAEDTDYAEGLRLEGSGRRLRITDGRNVLKMLNADELKRKLGEPFAGKITYGRIANNTKARLNRRENDSDTWHIGKVRETFQKRSVLGLTVALVLFSLAGGVVLVRGCEGQIESQHMELELNTSNRSMRHFTRQYFETVRLLDGRFKQHLRKHPQGTRDFVRKLQQYCEVAGKADLSKEQRQRFAEIQQKTHTWREIIARQKR